MEKTTHFRFERICVFCESSPDNKEIYTEAAVKLGKESVSQGIKLVYRGGSLGLMGAVAGTVHNGGCHVLGISPKHLAPLIGNSIGDLHVVEDMHTQKAGMMEHVDAFIALPGGYGTIEESFEVLCQAELGIHKKPVGVLNVDYFYDLFLLLADKMVKNSFLTPEHRALLVSGPTPKELIKKMEKRKLK